MRAEGVVCLLIDGMSLVIKFLGCLTSGTIHEDTKKAVSIGLTSGNSFVSTSRDKAEVEWRRAWMSLFARFLGWSLAVFADELLCSKPEWPCWWALPVAWQAGFLSLADVQGFACNSNSQSQRKKRRQNKQQRRDSDSDFLNWSTSPHVDSVQTSTA